MAKKHDTLIALRLPTDPTKIENGADYAGAYRACPACPERSRGKHSRKAGAKPFNLVAEGDRLTLHYGDERVVLEQRGPDRFYVDRPDFALFLLRFGREEGEVVEAFHGPDWYTNERYAGPTTSTIPRNGTPIPVTTGLITPGSPIFGSSCARARWR